MHGEKAKLGKAYIRKIIKKYRAQTPKAPRSYLRQVIMAKYGIHRDDYAEKALDDCLRDSFDTEKQLRGTIGEKQEDLKKMHAKLNEACAKFDWLREAIAMTEIRTEEQAKRIRDVYEQIRLENEAEDHREQQKAEADLLKKEIAVQKT